jgi:predicted Zn-dependent protease with MMP-like domain
MITIEETEEMLDEIATGFPPEIFKELNGGIILLPEAKRNEIGNNLYIMGEYHSGGSMGRYISIYYGSFARVHGGLDKEQFREQLVHTLKHEFTHHVESLAGEKDLEKKDAEYLADYLRNNPRREKF